MKRKSSRPKDEPCCGPAPARRRRRGLSGEAAEAELAQLAKALGHPVRVAIVRLLLRRETCVCGEIVAELPLAQSTVSQHLKVLKEAGLIRGEIDGPRTCYCIDEGAVERLVALIGALQRHGSAS